MNWLWLNVPPMTQSVLVDDTECLDGKQHAPHHRDPVYCGKCAGRLHATANHNCWYTRRRAYHIQEEPI